MTAPVTWAPPSPNGILLPAVDLDALETERDALLDKARVLAVFRSLAQRARKNATGQIHVAPPSPAFLAQTYQGDFLGVYEGVPVVSAVSDDDTADGVLRYDLHGIDGSRKATEVKIRELPELLVAYEYRGPAACPVSIEVHGELTFHDITDPVSGRPVFTPFLTGHRAALPQLLKWAEAVDCPGTLAVRPDDAAQPTHTLVGTFTRHLVGGTRYDALRQADGTLRDIGPWLYSTKLTHVTLTWTVTAPALVPLFHSY